jgi:hypothetical protein
MYLAVCLPYSDDADHPFPGVINQSLHYQAFRGGQYAGMT